MRGLLKAFVLAGAVAVTAAANARMHDPEKLPATRVRDLHYGDVLFYLYQGEDLAAATRLLAYQQWQRIPHHEAEGQLLLGGLYLSLGLHNEAGKLFQTLLNDDVPTGVRNRAWFYLAQVWYQRGYLDKAEASLRRINGRMSSELEAQKELLFANVLIHQNKLNEAIVMLARGRGTEGWYAYARFNLGVALVRTKRLADADVFLTKVGTMPENTPEMLALRDRANLALGFAYLQAGADPKKAREAFERVRLNGPFSNKALLGTGYADIAGGDYERALTPWTVLRGRNVLDAAVQESLIAVPYAYGKLGATSQSAEYYQDALTSLHTEASRLEAATGRIRDGKLLDAVISGDHEGHGHDWYWQLQRLPDAPESRYLYTLLAGYDFQVGLRSYRDMTYMDDTLATWKDSLEAFSDMIDTREKALKDRLPHADQVLASDAVEQLRQRRQDLKDRLAQVERNHDVAALGTPQEQKQWSQVLRQEAQLASKPEGAATDAAAAKLRLAKGVLYFRLNEAFNARLFQEQRLMRDLDAQLTEAQSRFIRVERARKTAPNGIDDFAVRLASLRERIGGARTRLASVEQKQKAYLAKLAINELGTQESRLATYEVQARFALANMYDRALSGAQDASSESQDNQSRNDSGSGQAGAQPAATTPLPPAKTQRSEPQP